MKLAYMNTDEVNQDLVSRTSADCGAVVCRLVSEALSPDGLFDAVLYNLDEMSKDQLCELLERLQQAVPHRPTAVHGYHITDDQARNLRRNGVAVARRLHRGLLRNLFSAAQERRAAVLEDEAGTELTWVNLAR